jgi:hypothetical protein
MTSSTAGDTIRLLALGKGLGVSNVFHGSTDVRADSLRRRFRKRTFILRTTVCCVLFVCNVDGVELYVKCRARRADEAAPQVVETNADERLLDSPTRVSTRIHNSVGAVASARKGVVAYLTAELPRCTRFLVNVGRCPCPPKRTPALGAFCIES